MLTAHTISKFSVRVRTFVLTIGLCLIAAGCARHSDRDWVIREFSVPQEVDLLVESTPEPDSNWADRKDLRLTATFKFTPTQLLVYSKAIEANSANWHALPISAELKKTLAERLESTQAKNALNKAAHGFYYLKTSDGANLLKTSKRSEWASASPDLELAILNADSAELKVFVRQ